MKKNTRICLYFIIIAAVSVPHYYLHAQKRGKELFDYMENTSLVSGGNAPLVMWANDGTGYITAEKDPDTGNRMFYKVDPESGERELFLDGAELLEAYNACSEKQKKRFPYMRFNTNPAGDKLMFGSFGNGLYVYDMTTGTMIRFKPITWDGPSPQISPDCKKIVYTKEYDMYMSETGIEKPVRLTHGGSEFIRNGRPDWVYPEELFQYQTFWWSPDSRHVAYLRFDENGVTQYPILHELETVARVEKQFYPKSGGKNPVVTLHIVSTDDRTITDVETGDETDVYIINGKWLPDGSKLSFQRLNRRQNKLELLFADPVTGKSTPLITDFDSCYFNLDSDLRFLNNGTIVWTSERSGWKEIYLYDRTGKCIQQLTDGKLPVKEITAVDEEAGYIYFTGHTNNGLDTHYFRVGLNTGDVEKLTGEQGVHRIKNSPLSKYYYDTFSSITSPGKTLLCRNDGTIIDTVSCADISKLKDLNLIEPELVTFKAADTITDLYGLVFKPADLDTAKQYPLLVYVYGGPWAKLVHNRFQTGGYFQRLAQLGYIVFIMDNRGTTQRGKEFETATYLKCGQVDLDDQEAGVEFLTKRPYIDGSRVGITGTSYGGYMTCLALCKKPDTYHAGVSVAAVTDWKNYDTIYTERYMQRPEDNPGGYKAGSVLPYAANLRGSLLIVHGTIDNNVHPANSVQFVQKLIELGKKFDVMYYPEQRHGIGGVSRNHLNTLTIDYFAKHLKMKDTEK